jgi:uncharacterized protein YdcH (DUF465 family)
MAVLALEESAVLVEQTASQFSPATAEHLKRQAALKLKQEISRILQQLEPFNT